MQLLSFNPILHWKASAYLTILWHCDYYVLFMLFPLKFVLLVELSFTILTFFSNFYRCIDISSLILINICVYVILFVYSEIKLSRFVHVPRHFDLIRTSMIPFHCLRPLHFVEWKSCWWFSSNKLSIFNIGFFWTIINILWMWAERVKPLLQCIKSTLRARY